MELTAYQQEMLDGVWGKGKSMAMQVLVGIGKCFDSPRLVPITRAHVSLSAQEADLWFSGKLLAGESPSPGELRKLLLCLGLLDRPELIVMDEPTNHLDLESKEALARVLAEYPGALIVVSHERWFIERFIS